MTLFYYWKKEMKKKYFGEYGWMFVWQPLTVALKELDENFDKIYESEGFQEELRYQYKHFVWRPTPMTHLKNISDRLGWAQIYVKREDMTTIWAHKINHTIVQWLLALRMWKKKLIAETWAGMHGLSVATVGAKLWLGVDVFMGSVDIKRQNLNVQKMKMLGANVISVESWSKTLKDAVSESIKYWTNNLSDSYYLLGSALWPYPYPKIVRKSQEIIGKECQKQFPELVRKLSFGDSKLLDTKSLPDYVVACVGWGSNAIWIFSWYLGEKSVKLIWVEAWWTNLDEYWKHASRIDWKKWKLGVFHGYKSLFLQDEKWNIAPTHSISAWLDYPGIGPEHVYLHDTGQATYTSVNDNQVVDAFKDTVKYEGIFPALESSHALAYAYKLAGTLDKSKTILVNLSGRGDKDLDTIINF